MIPFAFWVESGCGKSTTVNIMLGQMKPAAGTVEIAEQPIGTMLVRDRVRLIQPTFQDPNASLNRVKRIRALIA